MKKILWMNTLLMLTCILAASCGDDDTIPSGGDNTTPVGLQYKDYPQQWNNYMGVVSSLLLKDAATLNRCWTENYNGKDSYSTQFKRHGNADAYTSAKDCALQIIEGCADIANEVGETKIGDPYLKYTSGKTSEALLSVESWYSWHSIDDYSNNILSIRNSYYGSLDGTVADGSLSASVRAYDGALDGRVATAINRAYEAIKDGIQPPFRNNINSRGTRNAMDACSALYELLCGDLTRTVRAMSEEQLSGVPASFVDNVVEPTYRMLVERVGALRQNVLEVIANPTSATFKAAAEAWLSAREPWEKSEAFLFGPVDELQLDPNMDSWPLDLDGIERQLKSNNYVNLDWDDDSSDADIEAAQNVRGFHTLEYLLFENGLARTVE